MSRAPRAVWVFGPIGSGKSTVLARLPLAGFQLVDQDALLERRLREHGLPLDATRYDEAQRAILAKLRAEVAGELWGEVPRWRAEGRDLAFETTGDKPPLFRAQIEAGRAAGYRALGCALAVPLAECLRRNAGRERVLRAEVVEANWRAFDTARRAGIYEEIFRGETLWFCGSAEEAVERGMAWLQG